MRRLTGSAFLALLLVAGLVFGPAAHRVQHGLEHERSAQPGHRHSAEDLIGARVSGKTPSTAVDEATCILCQVVTAQVPLSEAAWPALDPGSPHLVWAGSSDRAANISRAFGRSPPRRA